MSRWYLKRGESEVGPGTEEQLKAAFKKGSLALDSLVKKEGQSEWVFLKDSGILSPEDSNPFVGVTERMGDAGAQGRVQAPPPGDVKPIIRGSMFKEKPRYSRKSTPVYATFADRLVAIFIDGILLYAASFIILQIFGGIFGALLFSRSGLYMFSASWIMLTSLIQLIIYGAYFVFLQHEWGYTIGRKIMGIHIEMLDRSRPDLRALLVRYVSSILSGLVFLLGYLLALSDPKMQTLHDRLANTIVVKD